MHHLRRDMTQVPPAERCSRVCIPDSQPAVESEFYSLAVIDYFAMPIFLAQIQPYPSFMRNDSVIFKQRSSPISMAVWSDGRMRSRSCTLLIDRSNCLKISEKNRSGAEFPLFSAFFKISYGLIIGGPQLIGYVSLLAMPAAVSRACRISSAFRCQP